METTLNVKVRGMDEALSDAKELVLKVQEARMLAGKLASDLEKLEINI